MEHPTEIPAGRPGRVITVTLVQSPACHFCADAEAIFTELAAEHPQLALVRLDAHDALGQQLMQQHRAAMSPLVLVDGVFFSQGRLPRGKLRKLRAELAAHTARGDAA